MSMPDKYTSSDTGSIEIADVTATNGRASYKFSADDHAAIVRYLPHVKVLILRRALRDNGYSPLPIVGKKPSPTAWQLKLRVSDDELKKWNLEYPGATNTGIITRLVPTLDIDIRDQVAADAAEAFVVDRYAQYGTILVRTGEAPKRCIPFRRIGKAFRKICVELIANDSEHKIELLANGQQFVVDGIHPDTGHAYSWSGGSPVDVRRAELPAIDESSAQRLVDDIVEMLCREHGYRLKSKQSNGNSNVSNGELEAYDARLIAPAVAVIENDDLAWDAWNRIGMAIFAASAGSEEGFAAFDAFSQKSKKYDARTTAEKWRAYKRSPPTRIGMGTVWELASQVDSTWIDRANADAVVHGASIASDWTRNADSNDTDADSEEKPETKRLILTSAQFVAGFVPPDYLIDGLLLRRYLAALTAPTGSGKTSVAMRLAAHIALGLALAGHEVEQGSVLYLAGENPDDVRSRWIKQCEELNVEPSDVPVCFCDVRFKLSDASIRKTLDSETAEHGPFSLIIVDTSRAYFSGDNENDNVQMQAHAMVLRTYVNINGGPTVLVLCHPVKNPDMSNLVPAGGGAFVGEIDTNFVLIPQSGGTLVELTWHGKIRGADFAPLAFKIVRGTSDKITDSRGRLVMTVTATPISDDEKSGMEDASRKRGDELLLLLKDDNTLSLTEMAERLGWKTKNGKPNKTLVNRAIETLKSECLIFRKRGKIEFTKSGLKAVAEAAKAAKT
jgi:hypothetical protein